MFRPAVFDVTKQIRADSENCVALCFDRPLDHIDEFDVSHWKPNPEPRVAMRKAQFGYGWDWGPRLPTVGIWRPVELRRERLGALSNVHFYTVTINSKEEMAVVAVQVEAELFAGDGSLLADIRLMDGDRSVASAELSLSGTSANRSATAYLTIKGAKLWWTHDLGEPHLYTLIR